MGECIISQWEKYSRDPKPKKPLEKIDKVNYIKIKKFLQGKINDKLEESICNPDHRQRVISVIYKEFLEIH